MSEVMINLRRSPRKLLERDGHPGPGPGRLALILARAGVGKTAFLVDVGMDALLSGQEVLHIALDSTVDKVRTWYDDILTEMLRLEKKLDDLAPLQVAIERRRHIHTYIGQSFSTDRLREVAAMLRDVMHFEPKVILLDEVNADELDEEKISSIKAVAAEMGAELWMACQTYREGPQAAPGHLPPPADQFEEQVDLAFRLVSEDSKVRLHVLKDHEQMLDEDLHIVLDPQTQLVTFGVGG
ncbi:MAG: hypothetical protein K0U98_01665 [Deltaproteobacteria bacterium]|nr:hypothetical protein [Deltaproteobacteria bacterium]